MNQRSLFLENLGQTSDTPCLFEADHASGIYIYDTAGNPFIDMVSGVSVSNLGHSHPEVVAAVKEQAEKHMHLMVYGEFIQKLQLELAELLLTQMPEKMESVYYVNSGSEAVEGALKLAKRFTGRNKIIACRNAYHGSTHGALSVLGDERMKAKFRPLLPEVHFIDFNDSKQLDLIDEDTAAVIMETIQAEAGIEIPSEDYLPAVRKKCDDTGALMILDEIQVGMGRTGKLFAFEHYGICPDICCLAKAFGGGMPLGAFVSSRNIMSCLKSNPSLGHITTFGGHPVSCAAALASLKVILRDKLIEQVEEKARLYHSLLKHPKITSVWGKGLLIGIGTSSAKIADNVINYGLKHGFISDWFLFKPDAFRIGVPLIITEEEIKESVRLIMEALESA